MTIALQPLPQRTKGRAELVSKLSGGRTRLDVFFQEGSAKIRIPESFDGRMEAVLINTSGGLTGGDRIDWRVEAGAGTDVTVTTQACERIYRSSGGETRVHTDLKVGAEASLAWLPQETILFDEGALRRTLDVDLEEGARFLALEAVLMGRKAMGERVERGLLHDRWRIRQAGKLIHAEDLRFDGDIADIASRNNTLAGHRAFATLLYIAPDCEAQIGRLRALFADSLAGASHWNGKLLVRLVAEDGFELRKKLIPAISLLRNGQAPPKVWHL